MVQGAGMRVLGFGLRVYKAGSEGLVAALLELLVQEEGQRACCHRKQEVHPAIVNLLVAYSPIWLYSYVFCIQLYSQLVAYSCT